MKPHSYRRGEKKARAERMQVEVVGLEGYQKERSTERKWGRPLREHKRKELIFIGDI